MYEYRYIHTRVIYRQYKILPLTLFTSPMPCFPCCLGNYIPWEKQSYLCAHTIINNREALLKVFLFAACLLFLFSFSYIILYIIYIFILLFFLLSCFSFCPFGDKTIISFLSLLQPIFCALI